MEEQPQSGMNIQMFIEQMVAILEEFDHAWVSYEQIYVMELMLIEADARLFITEAIESEKKLA